MIAPRAIPVTSPIAAQVPAFDAVVPRSVLRSPRLADLEALQSIASAECAGHMGDPSSPADSWSDFGGMMATLPLRGHGMGAVETVGETAGFVLMRTEPGVEEPRPGRLPTPACEGRGPAFEAARDRARDALRQPSLVSYVSSGNGTSERLAERLGAVPYGTLCDGEVVVGRHRRAAA